MKPTTIRLPEELLEALDEEAAEHDFHTRTEYLRYLIDHRELVISIALEQRKTRMDMLEDKLGDIQDRLEELETAPDSTMESEPQADEAADSSPSGGPPPTTASATEPESTLESLPDLDEQGETPEPLDLREPGPEAIEDRVEALDFFAPTREIRREREDAVVTVWETLVEYGELTREDFADLVFEDNTAAFSSFEGWYDRLIVPALDQLDDVERADEDTWRYAGERTD